MMAIVVVLVKRGMLGKAILVRTVLLGFPACLECPERKARRARKARKARKGKRARRAKPVAQDHQDHQDHQDPPSAARTMCLSP